jgi:predicted alpha/beta-hydrolase family hydrolase
MDENRSMVRFPGSAGAQLAARLDSPPGKPVAYALFAHCFTCSKDTLAASRVSTALTARGIAVLRFDSPASAAAKVISPTPISHPISRTWSRRCLATEHHTKRRNC